jgi:hypothetical protein
MGKRACFISSHTAGIFNAWNRAKNTISNLAQSPHREQQHDREQQQKDQEWRRFLLSGNDDYDREDIIISIDDVSAMSSPSTSSTLGEGSSNNDHNQENPTPMTKQQQTHSISDLYNVL